MSCNSTAADGGTPARASGGGGRTRGGASSARLVSYEGQHRSIPPAPRHVPDPLLGRLESALGSTHTIDRELGGGGMSRTYVATERALNRRVVVKVLAPELLAGVSVERFKREVMLAASLQHPHIVPVLATGDADGLPWFTMPYVEGESLRTRLGRGPMPVGEAVGILRDVARALAFAHGRGVVHRDIKPDNVLLSEGSATVTDFGIAKAISAARTAAPGATLTQAGTSLGTPAYMAPEQAAADPNADHRADLYAFGVMAYEMLTGAPMFRADTPARLLAAQLSERPRPISELRPDLPHALVELVMRCVEKEPTARPQQATDIVRVLESVVSSGASSAAPTILQGPGMRLGRALALWAAATLLVTVMTWSAKLAVGLPVWALPAAIGVMLLGLPVILFTAYVQRTAYQQFTRTPTLTSDGRPVPQSTMATLAIKASPHVSWRRTWVAGGVSVGLLILAIGGYTTSRAMGIGPAASLIGAGAIARTDRLVIADFRSPAADSLLGVTITEALRADLAQSDAVRVLSRAAVQGVLRLMQRPVDATIDFAVAREVATREGAKAIVDGEVVALGSGFVLAARLIATQTGDELGAFSETAKDADALLPAVERLSRKMRERIGESFRSIQSATPLERVTTSSVDALRRYVQGIRAIDERNDFTTGIPLLEEAVRLDTTFAMAYRKLAAVLSNRGGSRDDIIRYLTKAYELRDRLSDDERLLTESSYWMSGPRQDLRQAAAALQGLTERDSTNSSAFNNLGVVRSRLAQWAESEPSYRRSIALQPRFVSAWTNLGSALYHQGRFDAVDSLATEAERNFGADSPVPLRLRAYAQGGRGDLVAAEATAREMLARFGDRPAERSFAEGAIASVLTTRGQLKEGRAAWLRSREIATLAGSARDPLYEALFAALLTADVANDPDGARVAARRALQQSPIERIPEADRDPGNWGYPLARVGLLSEARQMQGLLEQRYTTEGQISDGANLSFLRATILMQEGRVEESIKEMRDGMARFPAFGVTAIGPELAEAYVRAGQPDSAIAVLTRYQRTPSFVRLTEVDPQHLARTHVLLGELYEKRGDTARAIESFEAFVTLWQDADADLQPKVREIRERITALRQRSRPG